MKTLFSKLQSHWWKPGKAGNLVSDLAFTFGKSKSEQQHVWLKTYKSTSHSLVPNLISLLQVPWHFPFPKQSICRAFQCICYPSGWAALLVVLPDCRQGTDPEGWRLLGAEGSAPKSSSGYKIPAKEQTDHWTCNTRQALASPGHHVTSTCILPQKKCSTFFYSENQGISEVNFYVFKPGALYFLGKKKAILFTEGWGRRKETELSRGPPSWWRYLQTLLKEEKKPWPGKWKCKNCISCDFP